MTDTADDNAPVEGTEPTSNEQAVADAVAPDADFSFVLDKYRAEGRTDQDAAYEQAKGYAELQKRFGSFTGAPEEYEVSLSEELSEKINLEDYSEDPILQDAKAMAKEWGMNNDSFNQLVDLYFRGELASDAALEQVREEEMKALGNNAQRRLDNIQAWAKANMDADTSESLINSLTSAKTVQAVEALIAKTRNVSQAQDATPAPAVSAEKVREMMMAKDEFGNDKMQDPAYASQVRKLYGQLYGEEPNVVTIGR